MFQLSLANHSSSLPSNFNNIKFESQVITNPPVGDVEEKAKEILWSMNPADRFVIASITMSHQTHGYRFVDFAPMVDFINQWFADWKTLSSRILDRSLDEPSKKLGEFEQEQRQAAVEALTAQRNKLKTQHEQGAWLFREMPGVQAFAKLTYQILSGIEDGDARKEALGPLHKYLRQVVATPGWLPGSKPIPGPDWLPGMKGKGVNVWPEQAIWDSMNAPLAEAKEAQLSLINSVAKMPEAS